MRSAPNYDKTCEHLKQNPKTWFVTGVAGFIGSHLLEKLLSLNQRVVGIDNFSTGYQHNLDNVKGLVSKEQWARLEFHEADIRDLPAMKKLMKGSDIVLHHAALGSVPRSLKDPIATHDNNLTGFVNILVAAQEASPSQSARVVYASSSSVYGTDATLPKVEAQIGRALSPYAVSKYGNEIYGRVFTDQLGVSAVGLRYFNVFGPRQDPEGPYAAVIPRWIEAARNATSAVIYGDGSTSRDFCFVANVVQANIMAGTAPDSQLHGRVYNVGYGDSTSLLKLFQNISDGVKLLRPDLKILPASHEPERKGDIRHSQASIAAARAEFGFEPQYDVSEGLRLTVKWYFEK